VVETVKEDKIVGEKETRVVDEAVGVVPLAVTLPPPSLHARVEVILRIEVGETVKEEVREDVGDGVLVPVAVPPGIRPTTPEEALGHEVGKEVELLLLPSTLMEGETDNAEEVEAEEVKEGEGVELRESAFLREGVGGVVTVALPPLAVAVTEIVAVGENVGERETIGDAEPVEFPTILGVGVPEGDTVYDGVAPDVTRMLAVSL